MRISGLVVLAVALTAAACGRPEETVARAEQIVDFETLYVTNCAGCHGINGRHGVAQPLNDPLYLSIVSGPQLRDVITHGVKGTPMTAFDRASGGMLTTQQIDVLVAGLRQVWGSRTTSGQSLPAYSEEESISRGVAAGDVGRGAAVYESKCATCHEGRLNSQSYAGSIIDESFLAITSDQALRTAVITGQRDEASPAWRDCKSAQALSEQAISDVIAWIASHRENHE